MLNLSKGLGAGLLVFSLGGCAITIPTQYTPNTHTEVGSGEVAVGDFDYAPAERGEVDPNQIQNTAIGSVYISTNVDDFVRQATELELERAGLEVDDQADYAVSGSVLNFTANDLGITVNWTYSVNYQLVNTSSGQTILDRTYRAYPMTTGKFGVASDYTVVLNQMVVDALQDFIEDIRDSGVFVAGDAPGS